jgi:hypothetical protein
MLFNDEDKVTFRDVKLLFVAGLYTLLCCYIVCISNVLADRYNKNIITFYLMENGLMNNSVESVVNAEHEIYKPLLFTDLPLSDPIHRDLYPIDLSSAASFNSDSSQKFFGSVKLFLTLRDPVLKFFRENTKFFRFRPYFADLCVLMNFLLIAFRFFLFKQLKEKIVVLRRVLLIIGTLYILRSITILLTFLPNPQPFCSRREKESNIFYEALLALLGFRTTCGDTFFSGHTIIFTVCFWLWTTYRYNISTQLCTTFLSFFSMILLLIVQFHYTIDVFMGFLLTSWVWVSYHMFVTVDGFRETPLAKVIMFMEGSNFNYTPDNYQQVNLESLLKI